MLGLIRRLYAGRMSAGDRLGEAFYAVWMAVISIGLLNAAGEITPSYVVQVVGIALSVNLAWGIIDGVTVMLTNVMDRRRSDILLYRLRSGEAQAVRDEALDALDDGVTAGLTDADKDEVLHRLTVGASSDDPRLRRYGPDRNDLLYALGIILIDVGVAIPVVAPLLLIGDVATAVYVSRLVATAIFASLGWSYAHRLNRNRWIAALVLGALGFVVFTHAYATGW